ncbi:cytochrome oxidase c subunit VIb-domain-containing protein [Fomes fomentarius]|nr:cytochrome oxidase c subunit VIb-domain-containing protein [Fomes fomentarius]
MGWFGTRKSETPDATSRKDRQKCWESRDAYFACLDGANVVKPGDEGGSACADVRNTYESNCAKSWIDYFNKRRVLAEQQQGVLAQARTQAGSSRNM